SLTHANRPLRPIDLVGFFDGHPRHPSPFGSQGVAGPRRGLFFHKHLLTRSLPLLPRHDRGCVHSKVSFVVLHVFRFVPVHVSLPFLWLLYHLRLFTLRRSNPVARPLLPRIAPTHPPHACAPTRPSSPL